MEYKEPLAVSYLINKNPYFFYKIPYFFVAWIPYFFDKIPYFLYSAVIRSEVSREARDPKFNWSEINPTTVFVEISD